MKNHFRKSAPINSSLSLKPNKNTLESEIEKAKIHSSAFKRHKKHESVDFLKTTNSEKKTLESRKATPEGHHYLTETRSDFYRKQENLSENSKILVKFSSLFQKENKKISLFSSLSRVKLRNSSLLKTETEKFLHQEYIKDRGHLNSLPFHGRKKLWRPDCAKTIRRVDKILSSIPKSRSNKIIN
jgi:hypothetical protein